MSRRWTDGRQVYGPGALVEMQLMTTLPQTTRPPQGLGLGLPSPYVNAVAVSAPAQMTGADAWRIIRANIWLILIMIILFSGLGVAANQIWAKYWPWYTATGLLQVQTEQVADPMQNTVNEMGDQRMTMELRTQMQLLMDPGLWVELFDSSRVKNTQWFKSFNDASGNFQPAKAKEDMEDWLRASPIPDSTLLAVRFTCKSPVEAKIIVEELVEKHLARSKENTRRMLEQRGTVLQGIAERYEEEYKQVNARIKRMREQLAERGMSAAGSFTAFELELRTLLETRIKLQSEYVAAKEMHDSAMAATQPATQPSDPPPAYPAEVDRMIEMDGGILSLEAHLRELQIRKRILETQYEPGHRELKQNAEAIRETEMQRDSRRVDLRGKYLQQYLSMVRGNLDKVQQGLKQTDEQIKLIQQNLQLLNAQQMELLALQDEEKRKEELSALAASKRIEDIERRQNAESRMPILWAAKPVEPDMPTWPKMKISVPVGAMLGLLLGLAIAFLREFLSDKVRSPRDVARVGQLNLLGIVADEGDDPQVAEAKLVIFDAPHSLTAEQFRQARTRLAQAVSLDNARSIMVTGPSPMDGKTTVAANLSASLALSGRKVLLVDGNFRRPELHRLFGIANEQGFSDVLNRTASLADTARASRIPNLSILTSGAKPANASELFESPLLGGFIEQALEEYDHVIFDSGPLLVVAESASLASRVDGVISVVRAHAESRGLLQRMRDTLRQLKAEHYGVILNAVRAQGGGYYRRNIKTYYKYNEA